MATMAELLVMVGADIGKYVSGMTRMEAQSQKTAKYIRREFQSMARDLAGLITVGAAAKFVKDTVDMQDSLGKMSIRTGIAVEKLSELRVAAELSDTSIESVAKGVKALSTKMAEAHDPTSRAGALFKALGVDINGGAYPALAKIADKFATLKDGPAKAAAAVEIFGKAGMDMIPMLNEGSKGLQEAAAEAEKFGLIVSTDAAVAAQKLNDNLKMVKLSSESMVNHFVNDAGDALVNITKAMKDAAAEGGLLQAALVGIGGAIYELAHGTKLGAMMRNLTDAQEELARIEKSTTRNPIAKVLQAGRIEELKKEIAQWKMLIEQEKYEAQLRAKRRQQKPPQDSGQDLQNILANAEKMAAAAKKLRDDDIKGWVKYADEVFAQADEVNLAIAGANQAIIDHNEALRREDIAGWIKYADKVFELADEENLAIAAINDEARKREEESWKGFLDGIESAFRDTWDQIGKSWKSALEAMRNAFKRIFLDFIYQALAKPFVLQIVAGVAGGLGMSTLANAATSSALSSAAGSSILSAIGGSAAASDFVVGMGAGINAGFGAYGSATAGLEGASLMTEMGAFLTNPATLAILAAVAIFAIAQSRRGGPKEGGSFFGTYDASGNFIGSAAVPGTDNGRFFTPNQQDSAMRTMADNFANGFFSTLSRLGGTTGAISFGLGTDQDPRGSAANRVAGAVYRDGMQIFRSLIEAGRDDEDLQRAFSLTMQRMMLAGLQSSALPNGIARILSTVSAQTGTEEEIKQVIELATAFGDLMTAVTAPFTSGGILEEAGRSATVALQMQGEALLDLADKTDMSVEDLNRLTQGTVAFRQAAAQLIITLNNLKTAALDTIDGLIEQTALAGMDPQQQFNYWQDRANSLFEQMMSSSDPAEIERLLGQFTTAWNNAWSLLSPEQQATEGGEWGRRLITAREMISTHINALIEGVVTDTNDVLAVVGDKMDAAADKLVDAAGVQSTAANTFAGAVEQGVKVTLLVDQYGNYIITDSGAGA